MASEKFFCLNIMLHRAASIRTFAQSCRNKFVFCCFFSIFSSHSLLFHRLYKLGKFSRVTFSKYFSYFANTYISNDQRYESSLRDNFIFLFGRPSAFKLFHRIMERNHMLYFLGQFFCGHCVGVKSGEIPFWTTHFSLYSFFFNEHFHNFGPSSLVRGP